MNPSQLPTVHPADVYAIDRGVLADLYWVQQWYQVYPCEVARPEPLLSDRTRAAIGYFALLAVGALLHCVPLLF